MKDNYYSDFIAVSHIAFGVFDLVKSRLLYSTEVANQMLGYSTEEISAFTQNNFESFVHPEDFDKQQAVLERLKNGKQGDMIESVHRLKAKSGDYIWIYIRDMVVEEDENGRATKIVFAAQDVSKWKNLEEKLKEQVFKLKEISHKNSHALRAPVATILGLLDLLEQETEENDFKKELLFYLKVTMTKFDQSIQEISKITDGH